MYRRLTRTAWFVLTFAVLVGGGLVLGVSQHQEDDARDRLVRLQAANSNLALVTQARLDDVLGQSSLAFTSAEDDDVAEHAERLRALSSHADPTLGYLLDRIATLDEADAHKVLISLSLDLHAVERATLDPVRDEIDAADLRGRWAAWLTGAALVALLVVEARRPEGGR